MYVHNYWFLHFLYCESEHINSCLNFAFCMFSQPDFCHYFLLLLSTRRPICPLSLLLSCYLFHKCILQDPFLHHNHLSHPSLSIKIYHPLISPSFLFSLSLQFFSLSLPPSLHFPLSLSLLPSLPPSLLPPPFYLFLPHSQRLVSILITSPVA